ncbi:DALR anticodon-binding domain-containing protein [Oscillatoria acuminata]|uniref:Arginyl-tRNA synthetase n=1 Tax=Oscillatoria acuminata PCC 6304 TaxID=56110 RepID=K9TNY7_9CYAN|nr:DALR anticodon-binding domain-containing protein [Oscillatoria acuminata]AFY83729.1 arginyl-tRNA synthetase [Oscillatoria acuminata PCC 6304]
MVEPLAIASQLLAQLQQAIPSPLASGDRSGRSGPSTWPQSIPLYRGKDTQRILYISPVALQLAKQESMPPMEIAQAIAEGFPDSRPPEFALPLGAKHWSLSVVPPGKLYLELTDPGIAIWLQRAITWDLPPDPTPDPRPFPPSGELDLFPIQYAHARCCALLRLAHREGLITLQTPTHPSQEQLTAPDRIPWLESPTHLKPHHPAERALISQAIATVDALSSPVSLPQMPSRFPVATLLSQDFLTFYAQCQIWGSVKSQDPDLAQARLGLIFLTQKLLKRLLEKELSSVAPQEL